MSDYLDPATTEYCERCRCKTRHEPTPEGERACTVHLEARAEPRPRDGEETPQ